jgi:prepilin-type N-terminal cleavage/methylation domain-containing protein
MKLQQHRTNPNPKAFSLIELSVVILIIGILVLGVTQGSRMMSEAKLKSARSLTTSSPVASIEGLAVWLDSTSENAFGIGSGGTYNNVSAPADGDKVGRWNDINPTSTSKIDVAQSTLGNQPIYKTNAINGLPALSFDGTSDYMDNNAVSLGSEITMFAVVTTTSDAGWRRIINEENNYYLGTGPSTTEFAGFTGNGSAWNASMGSFGSTATLTAKKVYVLDAVVRGSNTYGYVNGASVGNKSGTKAASTSLNIGTHSVTPVAQFWSGNIAEIIVFNRALNDTERKSVESYLGQKWGITVS